ncbi:acyl-CoA dehydrogenase family protein [Jannaschia ovalis]|uniref:Acyl-CoA dehydrogenase family protein n=1 Tax=Jannaschia ovalis TaxID=3038773 RepID=A0ABY8LB49_9RHOB|nr:acyl-CoA dehydrogenase family protein [Jannaschia sp. GRR-S6-38]WGH78501.1 acyl-CoA dehydrogenase family protein [Jannaschia sp. GRR-S6-38]
MNHEVTNQPPPVPDLDLADDAALCDALARAGGDPAALSSFGDAAGRAETRELARLANENRPVLHSHDRYGHRIDRVEFHPAYHELMGLGLETGRVAAAAWTGEGRAGHIARLYLMTQAEAGVVCPMSMTHAAMPVLAAAGLEDWAAGVRAARYDPRHLPAPEKEGLTLGMAMTEKQGGSDVRANTTTARPDGDWWVLDGHKWFCSAPMSDGFLTLAQGPEGLSCFLVPRVLPEGRAQGMRIMRLKDKMGDRANASSEIEYHGARAIAVGPPGRGIATIIAMVAETRLDCVAGSAGGMRAALREALWHVAHRRAFQRRLIDQPAMRVLMADLCLEVEAAVALSLRGAALMDAGDPLARVAVPAAKYWVCKRQVGVVHEALEAHGGAGYVEEAPMGRLFRAAPLNAVWEGSGNVIALDLLRALRDPAVTDAVAERFAALRGLHPALDAHLAGFDHAPDEADARGFAERLALGFQAEALSEGDPAVFEAFCVARLGGTGLAYGGAEVPHTERLIERAMPAAALG